MPALRARETCLSTVLAATMAVAVGLATTASAQSTSAPSSPAAQVDTLEKRLADVEQRLKALQHCLTLPVSERTAECRDLLDRTAAEPNGSGSRQTASLAQPAEAGDEFRAVVSGYMDFHYNRPIDSEEPATFDFHRFVLLFGHQFTDRIKFWSELEVEHGLVEGGEEKGALELEQAYLDFLITPSFNLRGGFVLTPVGIINERHEPPSYNGVERPFVDTVVIPSTWWEPGFGAYGDLGSSFRYRFYVTSPLDAAGFSADEGIRGGRQEGFTPLSQSLATTGRLEYHPAPRLTFGVSFWTGRTGVSLLSVNPRVGIAEFDGRYSRGRLDLRGEFAHVAIGDADRLNTALGRLVGTNPNIAEALRGFYVEPAIHLLPPRVPHDLVVFTRYENFDTQYRMPAGGLPLEQFDRTAWIAGASYYPDPDVAVKFDYTVVRSASSVVRPVKSFNVGLGWWF